MTDTEIEMQVMESDEPIQLDVAERIGGGGVTVNPLSVTENGEYTAPDGEAYSPVTVNVPQPSGTKQISISTNGTTTHDVEDYVSAQITVAVPQPSGTKTINISQNGTRTENVNDYASAEIVVAVPVPTLDTLNATDNGTYTPASGHAYSSVVVAIPSASGVSF